MSPSLQSLVSCPSLRFTGFKDAWKTGTISELGKVVTGGTPNTSDRSLYGGDFMFVSPSDIGNARYVNATTKTLTQAGHKTGRRIPKGSIVFVCIGSTIGKVAQVSAECTTNQQINAVIPDCNHDANFLLCVLDKEAAQIRLLAGKQAVPIINKSTFAAISITVPTLPEQRKIAGFLTAVDGRIGQLSQKKALLEDYKRGVMQQLFTQALRFKDEHGNDFPDWEEKTLGEVSEIVNGLTYSPEDVASEGLLVLRSSNVQDGKVVLGDNVFVKVSVNDWNMSRPNDILICVRNGSKTLIGKNAIIPEGCPPATHGAFMTVLRGTQNHFVFQLLQTDAYKRNVHINLGATINSINGSDLKKFKFVFPSLPEQTKIANFLSALDRKIESVSSQIRETQAFKKGLLQQMFV